ncbi:MAG: AarF/ABC1/UbiB kinase family protein, partial [Chloroflexi bacterium SZAS-1]|nr:AarF/ABC1/UbiB kinase family protein [Chloroflexi bacterium SZAS-1]
HAATLPQGEQVVVKVRRPSVDVIMAGDLNIMRDVITTLEQRLPWLQQFGVGALFKEFAENALRELDYTNEAFQGRVMRQNMQRLSFVQIPRSYSSYSTTAVLTQERVSGVKISQVEAIDAAGIEREPLALNFFRALLQQLLFDGFFHADLHPGNVWVNLETQRIVLLDMGMVGRLSRFDRLTFGQLLWALHERDSTLVMRVLVNVCQPAPGADLTQLRYAIERLINTYLLGDETSVDMAKLTNEMLALLVRYGLRLRQEFTLAFKSIGQGEAIMRMLLGDKPADYILEVAYTTLIAILKEQFAFKRLADTVAKPLLSDAIARGPGLVLAASALLSDFERGQSLLQLQSGALARQAAQFQQQVTRSVQRIVLAAALIGLLLGASLIFILPVEQYLSVAAAQVVRAIAAGSFALSAILLVVLALSALWQTFRAP